jgi:hypothetical protein
VTEPIQGFTSSSDSSSSGIVVASTKPRPPPPPPEQGATGGYATDHGSSRNVRPHTLPQHRPNPFGDGFSSGSEGAPGASASTAGPSTLKELESALKSAAKKKPPTYGPMATNYRNTSASSSSRGPLPPAPPPARPPDSDSSARSRGSRRPDPNTSARSGQR